MLTATGWSGERRVRPRFGAGLGDGVRKGPRPSRSPSADPPSCRALAAAAAFTAAFAAAASADFSAGGGERLARRRVRPRGELFHQARRRRRNSADSSADIPRRSQGPSAPDPSSPASVTGPAARVRADQRRRHPLPPPRVPRGCRAREGWSRPPRPTRRGWRFESEPRARHRSCARTPTPPQSPRLLRDGGDVSIRARDDDVQNLRRALGDGFAPERRIVPREAIPRWRRRRLRRPPTRVAKAHALASRGRRGSPRAPPPRRTARARSPLAIAAARTGPSSSVATVSGATAAKSLNTRAHATEK